MGKRKGGRPALGDRKSLSDIEIKYARLRAAGHTIGQASEAVGMRESEMRRREREFGLLKAEIERLKEEKFDANADELTAARFKILEDLHKEVTEKIVAGSLSINELEKSYGLVHQIGTDLDALRYQVTAGGTVEDEDSTGPTLADLALLNVTKHRNRLTPKQIDLSLLLVPEDKCPVELRSRRRKIIELRKECPHCHRRAKENDVDRKIDERGGSESSAVGGSDQDSTTIPKLLPRRKKKNKEGAPNSTLPLFRD